MVSKGAEIICLNPDVHLKSICLSAAPDGYAMSKPCCHPSVCDGSFWIPPLEDLKLYLDERVRLEEAGVDVTLQPTHRLFWSITVGQTCQTNRHTPGFQVLKSNLL